jgi:very-short-patch-repair endonuclease
MKWTKDKLDKLIKLYPDNTNLEISKFLNTTKPSVQGKARYLKLYKNKELRTKINKTRTRNLSYENLKIIAKSYKTKIDFREQDNSAYCAAIKMGIINDICSHMISQNISRPELILKYIVSKLFNKEILFNNKKIIKPYELDIYIPYYKLAFEYDGLYWHRPEIDNKKDELCIKNNIMLIRINEKDSIKYQLKKYLNKINKHCNTNIIDDNIINISENDILIYVNNSILDYDKIKEITNKYNNYRDFKSKEYSLYRKLYRLKLLNEYTKHMHKDVIYWNIKMCEEEISKYTTFNEFYKKSNKCYYYIQKHNLYYLLEKINYVKFKKKY